MVLVDPCHLSVNLTTMYSDLVSRRDVLLVCQVFVFLNLLCVLD